MGYEKMSHFDVLFFQKSGVHLKEQVMTCKFLSDPPGLKKNRGSISRENHPLT